MGISSGLWLGTSEDSCGDLFIAGWWVRLEWPSRLRSSQSPLGLGNVVHIQIALSHAVKGAFVRGGQSGRE